MPPGVDTGARALRGDARAAVDSPEARALRGALVASLEARGDATSARVLEALHEVPRHAFVPDVPLTRAYRNTALPIGVGQTISQPSVVAVMTDALDPRPGDRVLEIGTGSGYQTAILARLAGEVYSVEVVPELGERAATLLRELGCANVQVRVGDGYAGWPERAPFDRVLLTAAPPELPGSLLDQLADGGVLVAPVGDVDEIQWLVRVRKTDGALAQELLEPVRFVPMVRGAA